MADSNNIKSPSTSPTAPSVVSKHERSDSLAQRFQNVVRKTSLQISTASSNILNAGSAPSTPTKSSAAASDAPQERVELSMKPEDYELENVIGYGSSAVVYSAKYKGSMRVAIKIIDLDNFERNQIEELRRELQIMTLSKHKNMLPVYGAFVNGHKLYIVTPYLSLGSCLNVMKTAHPHGMEEECIKIILKECLQGLDYLHKNGHIHRDVKAGNLLIDKDGSVLLADFGVSSSLGEYSDGGRGQAKRKTFVGTPCWMSPEILMPETGGYDQKADIWSFGITALELAYGHAPYAKFPPMKVLLLTIKHAPPTLDRDATKHKYSKQFTQMIDMCLKKDPKERPSAEKLLEHSFFKNTKKTDYLVKNLLKGLPEIRLAEIKPDAARAGLGDDGSPIIQSWDFTDDSLEKGSASDFLNANLGNVCSPSMFGSPLKKQVDPIPEENLEETKENVKPVPITASSSAESVQSNPNEIRRGRFSVNLKPDEANALLEDAGNDGTASSQKGSSPPSPTQNPIDKPLSSSTPATMSRRGRFEVSEEPSAPKAKLEHSRVPSQASMYSESSTGSVIDSVLSRSRAVSENLKFTLNSVPKKPEDKSVTLDRQLVEELVQNFETLEALAHKLMEENEYMRRRASSGGK